jgi:uncharacterized protein YoaH (UPF0181 family)
MIADYNFKASNGKYITRQWFYEEFIELDNDSKTVEPLFTLYRDKPDLINLGKKYVEYEDPTGYTLATEFLGDYRFWTTLLKCKWFQQAKKVWDEELEQKLASKAIEKIKELMTSGMPAQQLAAAKYLANAQYRKDAGSTRGRPRKEEVAAAAKEAATFDQQLADDFKRIQLVKN